MQGRSENKLAKYRQLDYISHSLTRTRKIPINCNEYKTKYINK